MLSGKEQNLSSIKAHFFNPH